MHSIKDLQHALNTALSALSFNREPKELYEPISYTLSLGGKRMRPVLLLMSCDLFDGDITKAINPALGIEVFHNFTLLHDDIMDNAPLRRSMPTVHNKWDANVAILSGDAMLIEAYRLMMQVDNEVIKDVLTIFNDTAMMVCEGQQSDINYETQQQVSIQDYIQMISMKTAVLLAGSMQIGAVIAGGNSVDADHLYSFGKNLGIAFQLQDDILDVYGDANKFGKQVGGDIIANKKTYLLLKAMELAQGDDATILTETLANKTLVPQDKVAAITALYNRLGVKDYALEAMQNYYQIAMQAMAAIALPDTRKEILISFAERLMIREI